MADGLHFTQSDGNLTFRSAEATFNLRVAAVIRQGRHVLLHRTGTDDFWALPGGRPHHFESATDALRREMHEETGEGIEVGPLRAVIEVHFGQTHEINLCFDAMLPPNSRLRDLEVEHAGDEDGLPIVFRWFHDDELGTLRVLPRPVPAALSREPANPGYWFDDERAETISFGEERDPE